MATKIREFDFWVRVLRIVAIALGVYGALWYARGDTEAMQRPEGAMGRFPLPAIVGMSSAGQEADRDYSSLITIQHHNTFDFSDIQFFEIAFGQGMLPSGLRATVSVDRDLELAKWLRKNSGQRVQLVLRSVAPLTRDAAR